MWVFYQTTQRQNGRHTEVVLIWYEGIFRSLLKENLVINHMDFPRLFPAHSFIHTTNHIWMGESMGLFVLVRFPTRMQVKLCMGSLFTEFRIDSFLKQTDFFKKIYLIFIWLVVPIVIHYKKAVKIFNVYTRSMRVFYCYRLIKMWNKEAKVQYPNCS